LKSTYIMTTSKLTERTSYEWYREAERTYTEKHQGCPWCEGSHRVFCQRRGTKVIFYCQGCDFQASHDTATGKFDMLPGIADQLQDGIPDTMFDVPNTLS
jgi:hypothetical protein